MIPCSFCCWATRAPVESKRKAILDGSEGKAFQNLKRAFLNTIDAVLYRFMYFLNSSLKSEHRYSINISKINLRCNLMIVMGIRDIQSHRERKFLPFSLFERLRSLRHRHTHVNSFFSSFHSFSKHLLTFMWQKLLISKLMLVQSLCLLYNVNRDLSIMLSIAFLL